MYGSSFYLVNTGNKKSTGLRFMCVAQSAVEPAEMTMSARGFQMLKSWEGYDNYPTQLEYYNNGVLVKEPIPTIGRGHYLNGDFGNGNKKMSFVTDVLICSCHGVQQKAADFESKAHTVDINKSYLEYKGIKYGRQHNAMSASVADTLLRQELDDYYGGRYLDDFLKDYSLNLKQYEYDACLIDLFQKGEGQWHLRPTADYVKAKNYGNYAACETAFLMGTTANALVRRRTAEAKTFYSEKPNHPMGAGIHYVDNS